MKLVSRLLASAGAMALAAHPAFAVPQGSTPPLQLGTTAGTALDGSNAAKVNGAVQQGGTTGTQLNTANVGVLGGIGDASALTFGTYNNAVAAALHANTSGNIAQVSGLPTLAAMAQFSSRDSVTLYTDNTVAAPILMDTSPTYTTTGITFSTPASAALVALVNKALAQCAASNTLVCMMIDVGAGATDTTKYTGNITAFSATGATVGGWYQQGNTATGQVPTNGTTAYVNPIVHAWAQNSVCFLNANSYGNVCTGYEVDLRNNKAASNGLGTAGGTIGMSVYSNGTYKDYAGFLASGNMDYGYISTGNATSGYVVAHNAAQDPANGFFSKQTSGIPFAYQPQGNATPLWQVAASGQMVSTVATGTAPLSIASTTQVPNLYASMAPAAGITGSTLSSSVTSSSLQQTTYNAWNVGTGASTADVTSKLGSGRTASGNAYIDLIGDTTYTTYGLRILRAGGGAGGGAVGANASTYFQHRGTGPLVFQGNDAGSTAQVMVGGASTPQVTVAQTLVTNSVETTNTAAEDHALSTVTAATTLAATQRSVLGDTSGGAFTITLPACTTSLTPAGTSREYLISKLSTDTDSNALTVAPNGTDKIGAANASIATTKAGAGWWLRCNGATATWAAWALDVTMPQVATATTASDGTFTATFNRPFMTTGWGPTITVTSGGATKPQVSICQPDSQTTTTLAGHCSSTQNVAALGNAPVAALSGATVKVSGIDATQ